MAYDANAKGRDQKGWDSREGYRNQSWDVWGWIPDNWSGNADDKLTTDKITGEETTQKIRDAQDEKFGKQPIEEITRRPPKKGAPEALPGNLRYPFGLIDNTMDFIKFTVCRYKRSEPKNKDDKSSGLVARDDKDLMGTILGNIILPIPAQLSDANSVSYGPGNMNFMQEAGVNTSLGLLAQEGGTGVGKEVNRLIEKLTRKEGKEALSNFFSAQAVNTLGGNVNTSQVLVRNMGAVVNPNMELLFSGPSLRNFSYSFKLTPRFEQEAHTVRTIIKAFKRNMSPKGAGGDFLKTPNIFQIQYVGKAAQYLNRIKLCALTNVSTNYTGDGTFATYSDGAPISMQLSLSFSELTPIFNEDYKAYSDTSDGVGY